MWKRTQAGNRQTSERVNPAEQPVIAEDAHFMADQIERFAVLMEKSNFAAYAQLLTKPKRIIFLNLLGGIARGVGVGLGFTILGALLVYLLQDLAVLNLPVIGGFIADIVKIVQAQMHTPSVP